MDKNILIQYTDLQQEIADLRDRIDKKRKQIAKMEEKGYTVKDSVKGTRSNGTIGPMIVEGFPMPDYERRKSLLRSSVMRMRLKEEELMELTGEVEKYIDSIKDSRTRRIFKYRYLDNMTWVQVAHRIGKSTAEGCRSTHDRYLGIKK